MATILIVDDDGMTLEIGGEIPAALGYTAHTVMDGQEAVGKIIKKDIDFLNRYT